MLGNCPGTGRWSIPEVPAPIYRYPDEKGDFAPPAGTIIVSADNHFSLSEDIFYERFPARLKERAPRIWRDGGVFHIGFNEKSLVSSVNAENFSQFETRPGCFDLTSRIEDLEAEGMEKEIVFGNAVMALMHCEDFLVREWCFRIYNEYLSELQQRAPGKFYGVGFANYWDVTKTRDSLLELKALGIKTIFLPQKPGVNAFGETIHYHGEDMTPFWEEVEASGLPVCFHVGENASDGPRAAMLIAMMENLGPFRKNAAQLIFGGILDRHPTLQAAFIEAGINWIPAMLQDAQMLYASSQGFWDWKLAHEPEYYWKTNLHASFMVDRIGLQMIDIIGADRILWSSDYPHVESTLGYTRSSMREVVNATSSEDDARRILGGNAIQLFGL